jgi:hypothetical protein
MKKQVKKKPVRSRLIEADLLATPLVHKDKPKGSPSGKTPLPPWETPEMLRSILDQYRGKVRELLLKSFPGSLASNSGDNDLLSGLEMIVRSFGPAPTSPKMPGPSKVKRR